MIDLGRHVHGISCNRESHCLFLSVRCQDLIGIRRFYRHGNDFNLILILRIGFLHSREFHTAGTAPACPQIQQDHIFFFQNFVQGNLFAIVSGDGKIIDLITHMVITVGKDLLNRCLGFYHRVDSGFRGNSFRNYGFRLISAGTECRQHKCQCQRSG